eukprot:CAMPEP_0117443316 /NCGR_PEP_ID=MMETSP0759-20121206/4629_1 /TAXON_ID=63605 /ORGANISM="Percolomonas cosmopolitus, Strain WS" /LENGTH=561 /DNA_ID=CAMNT_0005235281 /DNA_START=206 /DNA_END=1891 /DNA_ORIENTATION=+
MSHSNTQPLNGTPNASFAFMKPRREDSASSSSSSSSASLQVSLQNEEASNVPIGESQTLLPNSAQAENNDKDSTEPNSGGLPISLDAILQSLETFEFDSSSSDDDDSTSPNQPFHKRRRSMFSQQSQSHTTQSPTSHDHSLHNTGKHAFIQKCASFDHYRFPTQPILQKLALAELSLSHCGLGDKGLIALSEALKVNSTVRILSLRDNWITPRGLSALVAAMAKNKTVLSLDLSENRLGMKRLVNEQRCGKLLAQMLERNVHLEHLYLKSNSIGDADVLTLCDFLCEDNHLRTLDLSYNDIGAVTGTGIKTLLSTNGYLKYLNLEWNALGDEGSLAVLEGLKNNNVLEIINMAWCGVSSHGALDIATVIQENTSLAEMNLEHNSIEYEQGVQYIAPILKENSSIRRLLLSHNPIGKLGVMAMLEGAQDNSSLELSLANVGVDWRQDIILKAMCVRASDRRSRRSGERLDVYELEQEVLQEVAKVNDWAVRRRVLGGDKNEGAEEGKSDDKSATGARKRGNKSSAPPSSNRGAGTNGKKKKKAVKSRPILEINLREDRYVLV